jgi:hypothetical protein
MTTENPTERHDYEIMVNDQTHVVTNVTPGEVGRIAAVLTDGKGQPSADHPRFTEVNFTITRID